MIIDLSRFINEEKPYWTELENFLDRMDRDAACRLSPPEVKRFHYLYQRASSALSRMVNVSSEKSLKVYLENLVGKAFAEIHETRRRRAKVPWFSWFFVRFPVTVRKHIAALWVSIAITVAGCAFGGFALAMDPGVKETLLPFSHLMGSPSERVAYEENVKKDRLKGHKTSFSSQLIANNTRVSIFAMGLGITWGIGTFILLFYNGVILGAVAVDYILAGQSSFLMGWLLPHGSVEIPSIVLAGQAGFVLAGAILDRKKAVSLKKRLREAGGDIVVLIGGVAVLLVWAGFVEAFLSQYHEPVIPYAVKTGLGCVELFLLTLFLVLGGRGKKEAGHGR
jgi:uncharacterized membrane protein SpoIIM required for sporulation